MAEDNAAEEAAAAVAAEAESATAEPTRIVDTPTEDVKEEEEWRVQAEAFKSEGECRHVSLDEYGVVQQHHRQRLSYIATLSGRRALAA